MKTGGDIQGRMLEFIFVHLCLKLTLLRAEAESQQRGLVP
jgi:hypothetical protein